MRVVALLCCIAALLIAQRAVAAEAPALTVPDTMAQRMQACTACHGKEGRATNQGYFPRIAGKPAGYLFNQLAAFRDGRRGNGTMAYLLANTSDAYLHEIAEYFSALDLPYPPPQRSAAAKHDLDRGESLILRGDASRRIPACVQCHGSAMTGVAPAVPGLLGLPAGYLSAQLGAWRIGSRKAATPDCMADIAQRLSEDEIGAVAAWLAIRPVPANAKPIPETTLPRPLLCGSNLP